MRDDPFLAVFGGDRGPLLGEQARRAQVRLDSEYGYFVSQLADLGNSFLNRAIKTGGFDEKFFEAGQTMQSEHARLCQPRLSAHTYVMPETVLLTTTFRGLEVRPWEWANERARCHEYSYKLVLEATVSACGVDVGLEKVLTDRQLRPMSLRWLRVLRAQRRELIADAIAQANTAG